MNWLCRPLPWKRRTNYKNLSPQNTPTSRSGRGKDPDSPIASSKNEQSHQHTKNETTITTFNQSRNKTVSQSVGDPCAGIPFEVIGGAFASSNALDDDISMMSCSIMRLCNDPLETWVERNANANNTFPWQPNNERWEHSRQDGEEDDEFTRVSI